MIALKALQKPADLRYTSADALADDLEAYLSGEPISARIITLLADSQPCVSSDSSCRRDAQLGPAVDVACPRVVGAVRDHEHYSMAGRYLTSSVSLAVDGRPRHLGRHLLEPQAPLRPGDVRRTADRSRLGREHGGIDHVVWLSNGCSVFRRSAFRLCLHCWPEPSSW